MIVEEAVVWYNAKLNRWVFYVRVLRRRIIGHQRLEYSAVLPPVTCR